jgi:hypothetical protein
MRQTHATDRSSLHSLPAAIGMHCALLSLASGVVSLVVAFMLWWQNFGDGVQRIGQQAGLFSAALGLTLAVIALASPRKGVRRLAIAALTVNVFILCLTIDSIFKLLAY